MGDLFVGFSAVLIGILGYLAVATVGFGTVLAIRYFLGLQPFSSLGCCPWVVQLVLHHLLVSTPLVL